MRVIFMGTPDFAVETLRKLADSGQEIVAVITAPDKPAGRGRKLQSSPVKKFAEERGFKILQPVKLRSPEFIEELESLNADLAVVVAFRMLPEFVWQIPGSGTLNLHASLLPDYRGAAPINHVIMNGETKTGLTTFFIDKKIDTGDLLMQKEITIEPHWTAGDLHDELMKSGAALVLETVIQIEKSAVTPIPQDESKAIHKAPKIFKEDCRIDWNKNVDAVYNFIRGLSPYPAAWTTLDGKVLKLFLGSPELSEDPGQPAGKIETDGKKYFRIWAQNGFIDVTSLQLEGKRRLSTHDFLAGYKFSRDFVE